jgi:hypothetical protein
MTLIKDHGNRQRYKYLKKDSGRKMTRENFEVNERQEKSSKCSSTSKKFLKFVRKILMS